MLLDRFLLLHRCAGIYSLTHGALGQVVSANTKARLLLPSIPPQVNQRNQIRVYARYDSCGQYIFYTNSGDHVTSICLHASLSTSGAGKPARGWPPGRRFCMYFKVGFYCIRINGAVEHPPRSRFDHGRDAVASSSIPTQLRGTSRVQLQQQRRETPHATASVLSRP